MDYKSLDDVINIIRIKFDKEVLGVECGDKKLEMPKPHTIHEYKFDKNNMSNDRSYISNDYVMDNLINNVKMVYNSSESYMQKYRNCRYKNSLLHAETLIKFVHKFVRVLALNTLIYNRIDKCVINKHIIVNIIDDVVRE